MGVGIAIGMSVPLVSLTVARAGYDEVTVGLLATIYSATMMVSSWAVPWVIRRIGGFNTLFWGVIGAAAFILMFPLFVGYLAWALLRVFTGLFNSWNWVTSEIWVNRLAAAPGGGRLIGIYATCFALGLALGPGILVLTGTEGWFPFAVTAGLMILSTLPLLLARNLIPPMDAHPPKGALWNTVRMAPLVIFGSLVCGVGEGVMFAIFPLWGLELGLNETVAVLTVKAVAIGNLFMQPLLGMAADRRSVPMLMILCGTLCLCSMVVLVGQEAGSVLFWGALLLVGGFNAGFYTLSMILMARRFDASHLPTANAAFVSAYTFGMIIGPMMGGWALQAYPPHGVMVPIAAVTILFIVVYVRFRGGSLQTQGS